MVNPLLVALDADALVMTLIQQSSGIPVSLDQPTGAVAFQKNITLLDSRVLILKTEVAIIPL